jgi:MFS family permease
MPTVEVEILNRNLAILLILNIVAALTMRAFNMFLPEIGAILGASKLEVGSMISLGSLLRAILLIPAGLLADRTLHDRPILISAVAGLGVALISASFANISWHLYIASALQGTCQAFLTGFLLARTATFASKGRMGRSVSYYALTFSLGLAIGAAFGGPLSDFQGIPLTYFDFGIAALASLPLFLLYKPGTAKPHTSQQSLNSQNKVIDELKTKPPSTKTKSLYRNLYGSYLVHNLGFGSFYVFFVPYILFIGGTYTISGIADALNQAISLILIPFMGELADRHGARYVILIAMWGDFILLTMLNFVNHPFWIFPLMILNGTNAAASMTGLLTMAATQTKTQRGSRMSTATFVMNIGFTITPLLGGSILTFTGDYFPALLLSSTIFLLLAALWSHIKVHPIESKEKT